MSFEAKYAGYCPECDDAIIVGDECSYNAQSEIRHTNCAPPKPQKVCGLCFLTSCDCPKPKALDEEVEG
jgi:hypothetical protein